MIPQTISESSYTPRPSRRRALGRREALLGAGVLAATAAAGWFSYQPKDAAQPPIPADAAAATPDRSAPALEPRTLLTAPPAVVAEPVAAPLPVADHGPCSAEDWAAARVAASWTWPERVAAIDPIRFETPTVKAKARRAAAATRRLASWEPAGEDGSERLVYASELDAAGIAPAVAAKSSGGLATALTTTLSKLDAYTADVGQGVKYLVAAAAQTVAAPKPERRIAANVEHKGAAPTPKGRARTRFTGGGSSADYAATTTVAQAAAPSIPAVVLSAVIASPAVAAPVAVQPLAATAAVQPSARRPQRKYKVVPGSRGYGPALVTQDGQVIGPITSVKAEVIAFDDSKPFGSKRTYGLEFLNGDQIVGEQIWQASPLVFDLAGRGPQTAAGSVLYDIDGKGRKDSLQWIDDLAPGTGLLVFDGDGDGKPGENGTELFGDRTKLDGKSFADGFQALRALVEKAVDAGVIAPRALEEQRLNSGDLAALEKAYGLKMKVGGFNKPAISLAQAGVKAIALSRGKITRVHDFDARGNDLMLQDGAVFLLADGKTAIYGDAWLVSKRPSMLSQDRRVDELAAR